MPQMSEKEASALAREALYWLLRQGLDTQFASDQDIADSEDYVCIKYSFCGFRNRSTKYFGAFKLNNKEIQAKVDEWFKNGFEKGSTPMQQMEQRMNPQFMESLKLLVTKFAIEFADALEFEEDQVREPQMTPLSARKDKIALPLTPQELHKVSEWLDENGLGRSAFVIYATPERAKQWEVLQTGGLNSNGEYCKPQALRDIEDSGDN